MKKTPILIVMAVSSLLLSTACKTTEANYRAAYERAKAKQNEGIDSATVEAIEKENAPGIMQVADGVSFPLVSRFVKVTEGTGATRENLKKYSVVVAVFSQLFNAQSMRERLVDQGLYPGAFVVQAGEDYYVVAVSVDDPAEAGAQYEAIRKSGTIRMKSPLPWVLRRPR